MTTAIPLDADGRIWLRSSDEALQVAGHKLTYRVLHYWMTTNTITPTRPPKGPGKGGHAGWSPHDTQALRAVAQVRHDLLTIGLSFPRTMAAELWDQLDVADTATITAGTVNITVHLGPED